MVEPKFHFGWLDDPRLAAYALSPTPTWLWRADGRRVLWANPVAAAIFGTSSPSAITSLEFEPSQTIAAQIARLAQTLPPGEATRLERLRGFGAAFGGTLICQCSRLLLADNTSAILVMATEQPEKILPLNEQARRLLMDIEKAAALFTTDGNLIDSQVAAKNYLKAAPDLAALGAENLAREALATGKAEGPIADGEASILRLGAGKTTALLVVFTGDTALKQEPPTKHDVTAIANPFATAPESNRLPFRFVWQMDKDTRFTQGIEHFAQIVGSRRTEQLNRPWKEIAAHFHLDPEGQVAKALADRHTWSGVVVAWPIGESGQSLPIEMSGLPVYDRERQFAGYRGFAICRDRKRLEALQETELQQTEPKAATKDENPPVNILPFPNSYSAEPSALSPGERSAFQELARELRERLTTVPNRPAGLESASARTPAKSWRHTESENEPILDRLPIGILIYRRNNLIYANRDFLNWTGYPSLGALAEAGGLDSLFMENTSAEETNDADGSTGNAQSLIITTRNGDRKPVDGRLFSILWRNENALALMINTQAKLEKRNATDEATLRRLEQENQELRAVLETATDGVLVLDRAGRILSANRSAQALFGYDAAEMTALTFGDLFVPESRMGVLAYLDSLTHKHSAHALNAGYEAIGRVAQGGLVPLYIAMGRIEEGEKFCVLLRDITVWKRTEEELTNARQEAEKASTAKSEFLAKISHEIRTPLNAILGFSEVMMDERFGSIGNERYRQYLKDIHGSGGHLLSLLNDLLDLSKIEAGKFDLSFVKIDLNELLRQCVAIMQGQANRERVIIRTSLPVQLPQIVADARSVRQIVLNLLSNSIKFTGAGGQVIVSTAAHGDEVVLRVRDTGAGMSEEDIQTALEPFRQIATSAHWGANGTGLGLPITKALTEANHARFRISSQINEGTLVEVTFPTVRVPTQ